jgi:phosphoribosylformylglycinamidine cyclo-ligase
MTHGGYEAAGVDYDVLDAAKRRALAAAATTLGLPEPRGAVVNRSSLGEPATVLEVGGVSLAFVLECLGTKSMIAKAYEEATGVDRFDAIGYDAVAAVVNDLCCVGALPLVINAYVATGSAAWYAGGRHASLVAGWLRACEDAGAAWGGGESPTLAGLVEPDQVDLAGSAVGRVPEGGAPWLGAGLEPGDEIVLVSSSGLHANGASLARQVAAQLPDGWTTRLASGRELGDAVLDPSALYARLVERLWRDAVPVRYASHVTGHGLRKIMRADRELTYRIDRLPEVPEVLGFLVAESGLEPWDAYATFNMGAGFAVFTAAGGAEAAASAARATGHCALVAGRVEAGSRQVVLEPLEVVYASEDLEVR